MSSAKETEARLAATMAQLNNRVEHIEKMMNSGMRVLEQHMAEESFKQKFIDGERINHFVWKYERSFVLRKCFTSGNTILPGMKAYKGTKNITPEMPADEADFIIYPQIVWLSREEFTVRKIKGQI